MSKKIITISREYGSGGRQIGQLVSKKLGMDFYDKELIDLAAKEIGFSPELIADKEQRVTNSLLYNFAMGSLYVVFARSPKGVLRAWTQPYTPSGLTSLYRLNFGTARP